MKKGGRVAAFRIESDSFPGELPAPAGARAATSPAQQCLTEQFAVHLVERSRPYGHDLHAIGWAKEWLSPQYQASATCAGDGIHGGEARNHHHEPAFAARRLEDASRDGTVGEIVIGQMTEARLTGSRGRGGWPRFPSQNAHHPPRFAASGSSI